MAPAPSGNSSTTVPPANQTLRVLVTNDDGFSAPGIDAAVQALRTLPHTQVTVVAPFANQSGTGGKTTGGTLTVTSGQTASGYPAKAVHGYPADTIIWAIDDHGISFRPNLVVSGINFGQNIGPLASGSGTVGAAQAALARGIPALAVSQGIDNGGGPDFNQGAHQLLMWVKANRATLLSHPVQEVPALGQSQRSHLRQREHPRPGARAPGHLVVRRQHRHRRLLEHQDRSAQRRGGLRRGVRGHRPPQRRQLTRGREFPTG